MILASRLKKSIALAATTLLFATSPRQGYSWVKTYENHTVPDAIIATQDGNFLAGETGNGKAIPDDGKMKRTRGDRSRAAK